MNGRRMSALENSRSRRDDAAGYPGIRVVHRLLQRLHEEKIAYCHWKSNEHLVAAIEGFTDLDVLIDRRRCLELQRILADIGFRRFQATPSSAYPAIEDYLGFDDETGRLVHLHLHYQLTLGQPHLKGYRLPWEHHVLEGRRFDEDCGIYVADPVMELVLLLVRSALKRRLRSALITPFRQAQRETSDFSREFEWLLERTDVEAVVALA
jgi:hypothetical protein